MAISERREAELTGLGFLPLLHDQATDCVVFFAAQTAQKRKEYDGPDGVEATENAAVTARLPYIMTTSRFMHYLLKIASDPRERFMDRWDVEARLNDWIQNYVCVVLNPSEAEKTMFPLRQARISVSEVPGEPGRFCMVAYLRPWLPIEQLTVSLRSVAIIPRNL